MAKRLRHHEFYREATSVTKGRRLVSLRRVSLIKNLDSSQTHEVVMVDGWPIVVEKGKFAVNQQVLYFAIDCVLPLKDKRYEPYRFSHFLVGLHGKKGWVVQTVKHEGHISQGMVFAIDDTFPEITSFITSFKEAFPVEHAKEILSDADLTENLKIRKWITFCEYCQTRCGGIRVQRTDISIDPRDGGVNLGRSPSFLLMTKSDRVQNIPDLWKTHGNTEFQITEILDGVPMIFYDVTSDEDDDFQSQLPGVILDDVAENGIRHRLPYGISIGKHDYKETETSISWKAVRDQEIKNMVRVETGVNIGLAGVLCGESIAGNPLMISGHRFYVYATCDEEFECWEAIGGWNSVPIFADRVRLSAFAKDLNELMKKAQGASCVSDATRAKYPSLKRKGLAFRTLNGSFSFKVIANDWLLDETEKLRKAGQDKIVSRPGPGDCVEGT